MWILTSIRRPCQYRNMPQFACSHSSWERPRVSWTGFPKTSPFSTMVLFRDFARGRLLTYTKFCINERIPTNRAQNAHISRKKSSSQQHFCAVGDLRLASLTTTVNGTSYAPSGAFYAFGSNTLPRRFSLSDIHS